MSLEIVKTSDGSDSLLNVELNETYHSVHGAIQESVHVFINAGLRYFFRKNNLPKFNILEIGFGTGLNAILTAQALDAEGCHASYTSIEAYPLPQEIWGSLNYGSRLQSDEFFKKLHESPWEVPKQLSTNFTLLKTKVTLQQAALPTGTYHLVYFDAFAPSKQPDMWTFQMLEKITHSLQPNGIFVTYCAKGQLKRDLKTLGLVVETLPGPPGKMEMVRAIKPEI